MNLGDTHANTIEGFWSLVERGINGVNHAVGAKYLQGYVNAYAFHWNDRNNEKPMFLHIPLACSLFKSLVAALRTASRSLLAKGRLVIVHLFL